MLLTSQLERETIVKEILNYTTKDEGQITTPLIIAARNGHEEVVHALLNIFCVDAEQTGTVIFDKKTIKGATALWTAASAGYFCIVKLLIQHGADVNHPIVTNSIPLRPACYDGRLDIVMYFVEHGADWNITTKYKSTCLMVACRNGHYTVAEYLIQQGVSLDCKDERNSTALHEAAVGGDINIIQLLLQCDAEVSEDIDGLIPLRAAALYRQFKVVEFLTSLFDCSRNEKVAAFELLATSFLNREGYDINKCYEFLEKAMQERYKDADNIIEKALHLPVPAYDNNRMYQLT